MVGHTHRKKGKLHRQIYIQRVKRQKDRQIYRGEKRETDKGTWRLTERQKVEINGLRGKRPTDRQTDKQLDRNNRKIDKHTAQRHTDTQTHTHI